MTENEKAATFIGWKPGEACPLTVDRRPDEMEGYVWHHHCACYTLSFITNKNIFDELTAKSMGMGRHDIPAPDMSKPENYMRALDNLRERGYQWSMGGDPEKYKEMRATHRSFSVAIWGHFIGLIPETYDSHDAPDDLSCAIISALAALYDAEQKGKNANVD